MIELLSQFQETISFDLHQGQNRRWDFTNFTNFSLS